MWLRWRSAANPSIAAHKLEQPFPTRHRIGCIQVYLAPEEGGSRLFLARPQCSVHTPAYPVQLALCWASSASSASRSIFLRLGPESSDFISYMHLSGSVAPVSSAQLSLFLPSAFRGSRARKQGRRRPRQSSFQPPCQRMDGCFKTNQFLK